MYHWHTPDNFFKRPRSRPVESRPLPAQLGLETYREAPASNFPYREAPASKIPSYADMPTEIGVDEPVNNSYYSDSLPQPYSTQAAQNWRPDTQTYGNPSQGTQSPPKFSNRPNWSEYIRLYSVTLALIY